MIVYNFDICIGRDVKNEIIYIKQKDTGISLAIQLLESRKIVNYETEVINYIIQLGSYAQLRVKKPDKTSVVVDVTISSNIFKVDIVEQITAVAGNCPAEIVVYNNTGQRLTSANFQITVVASAVADTTVVSSNYFNILTEKITQVLEAVVESTRNKDDATEQAGIATEQAGIATAAVNKTAENAEAAALSEANAADSKVDAGLSKDAAQLAIQIVQQVMADLLAMMGTDIPTMINGKVDPTLIPDIFLNVFKTTVVSRAALLALTTDNVQAGDSVKVIADDDGYGRIYVLMENGDPSVFEDWMGLNTSDMHIGSADHATTADEASNALKVNGHRLVRFDTVTAMINAVKTEDDLYFAPVGEVE